MNNNAGSLEQNQIKTEAGFAEISRRRFLKTVVKISAMGTVGSVLAGCASGGLPLVRVREEEDYLKLVLAEVPELAMPGGAVTLTSAEQGELNIIVLHLTENEYIALSPVCTHLGCRVRKARDGFECPCHGSRYDLRGQVVNGPAARNLAHFPMRREGNELLIDLSSQ
ncbi:ubiquinol-cytochrome c reductase iron-sulfur subunit [candidate division KSB1 bacterium]|nr:ubiquinol-cytochrome c reductase iron-sulfur subunit [candidate division KSB1 bacterium]